MPKLVVIPDKIPVLPNEREPEKLVPVPFAKWVEAVLDNYDDAGHGLENIRRSIRIVERATQANGSLTLDGEDHKFLTKAMNGVRFNPRYARMTLSYFEAVEAAKEV